MLLNEINFVHDNSSQQLRIDHAKRPIYVCDNGHIFLETFSTQYERAYDFLIAIAEPICRPNHIHEYKITPYSLYAAASIGLTFDEIIYALDCMSKTNLSEDLIEMIRKSTEKCGKVKIVLRNGHYYVQSIHLPAMNSLQKSNRIRKAVIDFDKTLSSVKHLELDKYGTGFLVHQNTNINTNANEKNYLHDSDEKINDDFYYKNLDDPIMFDQKKAMGIEEFEIKEKKMNKNQKIYLFEIESQFVEMVQKECLNLGYPSLEEYDFRNDAKSRNLNIHLKSIAKIRPYQEKSLSKMFGNGRARSGIIVLPCGAGKTLVGITAACTIKKSVLVLATTGISCEQQKGQFRHQAQLGGSNSLSSTQQTSLNFPSVNNFAATHICMFSSTFKDPLPSDDSPCILISTYSMISYSQRRSRQAEQMMQEIQKREWGLLILDEVHVAPADMFRKCLSITKSRCKLGLTATLVREDEKIEDLFFLIGPKLYEADQMDLQRKGHIATVECIEVWCPMAPMFYRQFLREKSLNKRILLSTMNPNKFRNCEYLIKYHERLGDKILVFSDNIFSLEKYARMLNKPYVYGKTSDRERMATLLELQNNSRMNTVFISKVGDCSIDLPDVNVIIQISSHFSARRQEAQRLGRILRPKTGRCASQRGSAESSKAYFYTLVSQDTEESLYSAKRQRFLVDQGYSFHVKNSLVQPENLEYKFSSFEAREKLLIEVMTASEEFGAIEADNEYHIQDKQQLFDLDESETVRRQVSMAKLSTADASLTYEESKRQVSKTNEKKRSNNKNVDKSSKLSAIRNRMNRAKIRKIESDRTALEDLVNDQYFIRT